MTQGKREDPFELERFVKAQEGIYDTALSEAKTISLDVVHLSADRRSGPKLNCRVLRN
jgi:hypothetical protein